jgi:membrane protein DedA with SNARE-associated domain
MVDFSLITSNFGTMIGMFLACALGVPVPEEVTLISAGVLVSTKQPHLTLAAVSGLSGILISDATLYFLGRYFGPRVFELPLFRTVLTEPRVKWAESRIRRYGPLVCFVGRFLPGLRIAIFTTSGALGLKPQVFLLIDALAAVIIVSLWISLGHWMGANFIDATRYAQEIKVVLIAIAVLIFVINVGWRLRTRNGDQRQGNAPVIDTRAGDVSDHPHAPHVPVAEHLQDGVYVARDHHGDHRRQLEIIG